MNQPTLQLSEKLTITLPQLISDVKRAHRGYRILSGAGWKFYATDCLNRQQVDELEDWLEELKPARKAA